MRRWGTIGCPGVGLGGVVAESGGAGGFAVTGGAGSAAVGGGGTGALGGVTTTAGGCCA